MIVIAYLHQKEGENMKKRPSNKPIREAIEKIIGRKLPKRIEIDHKIPLKDGGKHTPGNIQLLTRKKHQVKTAIENSQRTRRKRK